MLQKDIMSLTAQLNESKEEKDKEPEITAEQAAVDTERGLLQLMITKKRE